MAYTIQILEAGEKKQTLLLAALQAKLVKDGKYNAKLVIGMAGKFPAIICKTVRLAKAKPYCGNHPGECEVIPGFATPKKKVMTYLEWDDWVKFHALVNGVLDRLRIRADVWSNPQDVPGKMWIRKGMNARVRWDWTENHNGFRTIRIWNQGSPDQFLMEV